jgi:hypothetical protein
MNVVTEDELGGLMSRHDGGTGPERSSGRQLRELIADDAWLDELIDRADEGGGRVPRAV